MNDRSIIEKYRKPLLFLLIGLAAVVNLMLADRYIFPKRIETDTIRYYSDLGYSHRTHYNGKKTTHVGYRFITQKGYEFSLDSISSMKTTLRSNRPGSSES